MQLSTSRLATVDDAELVRAISASAYIPAYEGVIGAIPLPAQEDYTDRILNGDVWIAEVEGVAAGVLVVEEGDSFLMVYSVAVSPQYQNRGLGKELLAHAESCAAAKRLREIRLYTNSRMSRNIALYEHYGFIRKDERPHPSRVGEMLLDMHKKVEIGKA
ncbi:GNAT family N-acetyltransferase [Pseudomonas sp. Irchel 3A5]|uniref:GNAT family N-acetyltransferase n=1 Tax=Pseudomonas sp. Irchel 3A5 TaxID=2008911 RepID=UPI000BA2D4FA|nr:GNAT family N-acetyltransferase [Pseudomonas sp. Irchel 3A5]